MTLGLPWPLPVSKITQCTSMFLRDTLKTKWDALLESVHKLQIVTQMLVLLLVNFTNFSFIGIHGKSGDSLFLTPRSLSKLLYSVLHSVEVGIPYRFLGQLLNILTKQEAFFCENRMTYVSCNDFLKSHLIFSFASVEIFRIFLTFTPEERFISLYDFVAREDQDG